MSRTPFVVAVVGPTATGKSQLADNLARHFGSVVISADSMQIYRGLDIGTAKTKPSMRTVPYYGLDLIDPDQPYSAARYQAYARPLIDRVLEEGRIPFVCGGTGLYVRAALDRMEFPTGRQRGNTIREHWQSYLEERGAVALFARLEEYDPPSAQVIDPSDHKRIIRALEMYQTGDSYAHQKEHFKDRIPHYRCCYIGVDISRERLYERIGRRVDEMMAVGLLDEVAALRERGLSDSYTARHAIGYKELLAHLEGRCGIDEAVDDIKRHTRNYAKRQLTWFRADPRVQWIACDDSDQEELEKKALALIAKFEAGE